MYSYAHVPSAGRNRQGISIEPSVKSSSVKVTEGISAAFPLENRAFADACAFCASSSPCTSLVNSNARISLAVVDGEKVSDPKTAYQTDDFSEGMVLKKGKKNFRKILK